MNLVWGHRGPYFHAPCQRDRFPSLVDELGQDGDKLVSRLGIANIADMGARLKRGRKNSNVAEQQAAENVKDACVPLHKMFHGSPQGLRRGVDKFAQIPKYDPYMDEQEQRDPLQRHRRILMRPNPVPALRQAGEQPYTGGCQHCRRRGSNDVANDFQGRLYLQQAYLLGGINQIHGQQAQNEGQRNRNFA